MYDFLVTVGALSECLSLLYRHLCMYVLHTRCEVSYHKYNILIVCFGSVLFCRFVRINIAIVLLIQPSTPQQVQCVYSWLRQNTRAKTTNVKSFTLPHTCSRTWVLLLIPGLAVVPPVPDPLGNLLSLAAGVQKCTQVYAGVAVD